MQYKIVSGSDRGSLEYAVNQLLAKGWKLQGGVIVDRSPSFSIHYLQAMIKE